MPEKPLPEPRLDRFLKKLYQALRMLTCWLEDEYEVKPRHITCPGCGQIVDRER